jgi:hypothetical protein
LPAGVGEVLNGNFHKLNILRPTVFLDTGLGA